MNIQEIQSCNTACTCCQEHEIIENNEQLAKGFDVSQEANKHFNNF
ncbi:MAG: hypothetical protein P4L22_01220 [Candidatus Babeliales bacterium]|nr:hypothetical protein [Candidatus Babeliales bacterium]